MKWLNHRVKKIIVIICGVLIIASVLLILFISPITKYLIEKYDEKYTGRQITVAWAYVNPFTGYIHLSNLKIYESKSDSIFIAASGLSVNIDIYKIFSKTYEIREVTLDHPRGIIIQNGKKLNFSDLIEKFSSKKSLDASKVPVHFNIQKIKITEGEFHYREQQIPINYFIKKVNLESAGKHWDQDSITFIFSFLQGMGKGDIKGDCMINFKSLDYRFASVINKFELQIIEQYLKELTNYGTFRANLDADIKANGNFNEQENITATGLLSINDFHFGKNKMEDYASFDKVVLAIEALSPKNHKYLFDSIAITHPFLKYEKYDYLDNLQMMFGKNGSNISAVKGNPAQFNLIIEIARYVKVLAKNFFRSNYKINRLAIYRGDLKFNDFSQSEKFSMELNPLFLIADSINKNHKRVSALFESGIQPYGNASVTLSINPKDNGDFDLQYKLHNLPVPLFNPYIITYTSFPMDRGTIGLHGKWNVRNDRIQSENHVIIIDPRVSKRIRNKDTKWIPLPLVMAFIRERGNVIDYEIPISGNLNDPKFHLRDVVFDVIKNIFVKPATIPYRFQVKSIENEIEKSLTLKWGMQKSLLYPNQIKFIEKISDYLEKNPEASVDVFPQQYSIKEKEYILFFEAKKKYFLLIHKKNEQSFNEDDMEQVEKMSAKDSFFVGFLNHTFNDSMLFTIQEKCKRFVHSTIVDAKYKLLNKERLNAFISYFKENGVENKIRIHKNRNVIPKNGFSFYKLVYKGELPGALIKSYRQMNELNDKLPRKKFKKERKDAIQN
ncbi:MAG: DUF748 domain-containing protein [Bacteroidota bacterium]|nr:DUF748 domain-containing protein [Bacteroidota bacterium]